MAADGSKKGAQLPIDFGPPFVSERIL